MNDLEIIDTNPEPNLSPVQIILGVLAIPGIFLLGVIVEAIIRTF